MGILSVGTILPLGALDVLSFGKSTQKFPVFFFGHGSPMNAIEQRGVAYKNAIPTPDHYWPALYALAAMGKDEVQLFNEYYAMGSLSMHSFKTAG